MTDYYSDLKAAWHLDRVLALREGRLIVPVELQLILSDLCNHDCYFCAYRSDVGLSSAQFVEWDGGQRNHNPNRMIATAKAREILDDAAAAGVKSIVFTGGGEPTVHPHHLELFRRALELGLDCSLNTNGALLRRGWQDVLPRFKYIRFSIDAGTAEDYAAVRRVPASTYERVLDNLRLVVEACRPSGCTVGTGYVVTPTNYQHLVPGVRRIRETGAAYVRLASMQTTEEFRPFAGVMDDIQLQLAAARLEASDQFQVVDRFDAILGRRAAAPLCGMQHFVLYVGGNLKLYRCCYTAYSALGEIGDLSQQRLSQWFASAERERALRMFDAQSCAMCPLEDKNATIRYMVHPGPEHVNFV